MSEIFVPTSTYSSYIQAAPPGGSQPVKTSPEVQLESEPIMDAEPAFPAVADWQPEETDLLPSFGVERARELLMWLINLELRLAPYTEVSPA
ncbi:MAG: hypothetical protein IT342_05865 [Candidatus Melainabacteria bacterium]|nr:hypothetical protein [Candidatus Melainabacteria bacterium]